MDDPACNKLRFELAATNRLVLDREKGMSELATVAGQSTPEVAALAKFALAQAKEKIKKDSKSPGRSVKKSASKKRS